MSFEQIGQLDSALAEIDAAQAEIDALKAAQPDAYARVMENWAVESTYNSNNIEGSTLTLGQTALVFEGALVEAPAADIAQAEGGFLALKFLQEALDRAADFDEALVLRAHEILYAEANDPAARGAYRTLEVEITGTPFEPTPSMYVPERMAQLISSCAKATKHPAVVAALFHLEFESIHPFVNANGRTGRLISNYLLMRAGFEPVNIQAESRARYIAAIRAFQIDDDPFPFVSFFCNNLRERQQKVRALLTDSNGEGRPAPAPRTSAVVDFLTD